MKLIRRLGERMRAAFIINLFDLGGEQRAGKQGITCYSTVPFSRALIQAIRTAILARDNLAVSARLCVALLPFYESTFQRFRGACQ